MEPTRHDAAGSLAFTASACGGAIRLRALGRRTLVADHHEHQLHVHLVAVLEQGGRELRANKSGSAAEFLTMGPGRRADAVARVVGKARFPPGCSGAVARFCELATRAAKGRRCDDVTVTVDWTPMRLGTRRERGGEVAGEDAAAVCCSLHGGCASMPSATLDLLERGDRFA